MEMARSVMSKADRHDHNGQLTVNEIVTFCTHNEHTPFVHWLLEDMDEFREADKDHSATLDIMELASACLAYIQCGGLKREHTRTDSGGFRLPEGNPVKEKFSGRILSFEEVVDDINKDMAVHCKNKDKMIRTAYIRSKGMKLLAEEKLSELNCTPVSQNTGFPMAFLEVLAREFHTCVRCNLDEVVYLNHKAARIDYSSFKRLFHNKRFHCNEILLKRLYKICDVSNRGAISFKQLAYGLVFFDDSHPFAEYEAVQRCSPHFLQSLVKFMDLEANGSISKLSMYCVCDTALSKELSYLLCDAVWEILTGGSRSMGSAEFMDKLSGSKVMRKIFYNLMTVQCMREGYDLYGDPFSNRDKCIREIEDLTRDWCRKKSHGRYYSLDVLVMSFKQAVDEKDEKTMWKIFNDANNFQNKLRGQEAIKAGHYVKVMMGLLEVKDWSYIAKEHERVGKLLRGERDLSENQIFRFQHLLHVLDAFLVPESDGGWGGDNRAIPTPDNMNNKAMTFDGLIVRQEGRTLMGSAMTEVVHNAFG